MGNLKTLIVIVGPTAIGKTDLAIKLARHYHTEIVSADSRQFYKEMNIGTARPSPEELAGAVHHFIASHSIQAPYSAGDFETDALNAINDIFQKSDYAVLAGGSGLFVKAVTDGFDDLPQGDEIIRTALNRDLTEKGLPSLLEQLRLKDPSYYNKVDKDNPQRVIRALEVILSTGQPFSSYLLGNRAKRPFRCIKIALNVERAQLYDRINRRVDLMLEQGFIAEVESLIPFKHLNALNTVGYSELFDYFEGKRSLDEAVEAIKQNTRRFAKRQLTWFRKDTENKWFSPSELDAIINHININT